MSHYAEMECEFDQKNEKDLVAALEECFGEGHVEVHEEGKPLYGWHGDDRSKVSTKSPDYAPPCEIIVRRKHVGGSANDVGFKRTEDGKYKSYISEYDNGSTFTKARQHKVAQTYGVRVAERTLKAEGWKVHTVKQNDGSVKVVAKDQVKIKNW